MQWAGGIRPQIWGPLLEEARLKQGGERRQQYGVGYANPLPTKNHILNLINKILQVRLVPAAPPRPGCSNTGPCNNNNSSNNSNSQINLNQRPTHLQCQGISGEGTAGRRRFQGRQRTTAATAAAATTLILTPCQTAATAAATTTRPSSTWRRPEDSSTDSTH